MSIRALAGGLVLLVAVSAYGEEILRRMEWSDLEAAGELPPGTQIERGEVEGQQALRLVHRGPGQLQVRLFEIDDPGITTTRWAVRGRVCYDGVQGEGFVELWSSFDDGGRYYSRTLADRGPAARILGDSEWRPVVVPFFAQGSAEAPTRLELNLVLPGPGQVTLSALELVQYDTGEDPLAVAEAGAWWSSARAARLGALAGAIAGLLGALVGVLTAIGKGRGVVLWILGTMVVVGLVALAVGVTALLVGQPYAVWYPPALVGLVVSLLGAVLMPVVKRSFALREERRMKAMDL
jgi:hypothetical protein